MKNGIRLSGYAGLRDLLTEPQMWQVTELLAVADKPLPQEAQKELSRGSTHGPGKLATDTPH